MDDKALKVIEVAIAQVVQSAEERVRRVARHSKSSTFIAAEMGGRKLCQLISKMRMDQASPTHLLDRLAQQRPYQMTVSVAHVANDDHLP